MRLLLLLLSFITFAKQCKVPISIVFLENTQDITVQVSNTDYQNLSIGTLFNPLYYHHTHFVEANSTIEETFLLTSKHNTHSASVTVTLQDCRPTAFVYGLPSKQLPSAEGLRMIIDTSHVFQPLRRDQTHNIHAD